MNNKLNKTLLVGNGINRTLDDKCDAFSILSDLNKKENLSLSIDNNSELPFQLLFESVYNRIFETKNDDNVIIGFIKNRLKDLNTCDNPILKLLKEHIGKYDSIVTTNYDFALEYNIFCDRKVVTNAINRNMGYHYKNFIYHIHGDFYGKHTICLGRVNYQKYFKANTSHMKNDVLKYESLEEICKDLPNHLSKFLTNDMDIIGFNLDSAELIIWYILTLRAFLISCSKINIENEINYYDLLLYNGNEDEIQKKCVLLKEYFSGFKINYIYEIKPFNEKNKGELYKRFYKNTIMANK